jgi:hypothetical protein
VSSFAGIVIEKLVEVVVEEGIDVAVMEYVDEIAKVAVE